MKNTIIKILPLILIMSNTIANDKFPNVDEKELKGIVRTNLDSPKPTKDQKDRRTKFTKLVASFNAPVLVSLPVVEDSKNITPRTSDEISQRTIAVAIAAVKGEGVSHEVVMGIVNDWKIIQYFSPEELQFIKNPSPTDSDRIKFAWRYEGLNVLLWALGYNKNLPEPNVICNVKEDLGTIKKNNNPKLLAKNSNLRSIDEILDMADFYYRLHWSAIELRLNDKMNDLINEEIIMERHYALNWLIKYFNQDWDDISTDT